ncbi:hypothetical protein ACFP3Q_06975 [Nocardioides sp. GCM10027113]|uniref:hypothetical protein n=1 Tax=unclassified Nocardioides TaxID=2615069 RepID=UPI00361E7C75
MRLPRVGRLLGGWHEDPLWATVYDWTVSHPRAGTPLWRLGLGSDLGLLYAAAGLLGDLPAGARVLDRRAAAGSPSTGCGRDRD